MVIDYGGAWIAEIVMKYFFSDHHPKPIITKGVERREARRAIQLKEAEDEKRSAKIAVVAKKDL